MQRGTNPCMLRFQKETSGAVILMRALVHTVTRLALQWILDKGFELISIQVEDPKGPLLLFFVTTSPSRD